jgi:hypothetical protein
MSDPEQGRFPGEQDRPEWTEPPWWAELLMGRDPAPSPSGHRPVWNAAVREDHRTLFGATGRPVRCYPLLTFYARLGEALEEAKRQGQPLAVVVLQWPGRGLPEPRRQREGEFVVRLRVRREDLVGRLSPTSLAVALVRAGADVGVVALRLQRVLSRLAGGGVGTGTACFPTDGHTARALLRVATGRSLAAQPGAPPEPELTQLLGPLGPGEAEGGSP